MQSLLQKNLPNPTDTQAFAAQLAQLSQPGDCIALTGYLGAGKTTFAQGFIRALAGDVEVTSPTFTLLQTYESTKGTLHHFDLYRLKSAAELRELGLDEALERGITLIEWPEIAVSYLPEYTLYIHLQIAEDTSARLAVVRANSLCYSRLQKIGLIE